MSRSNSDYATVKKTANKKSLLDVQHLFRDTGFFLANLPDWNRAEFPWQPLCRPHCLNLVDFHACWLRRHLVLACSGQSVRLHYSRARGFSLPGGKLDFHFNNKTCMTESLCNVSNTTPTMWGIWSNLLSLTWLILNCVQCSNRTLPLFHEFQILMWTICLNTIMLF